MHSLLSQNSPMREKVWKTVQTKNKKVCTDGRKSIQVKSISSSDGQESMRRTSSGRSNFPAEAEMDRIDLLPDLEELRDRVTPEQLERLKALLEANAAVFARNKADIGRCKLVEQRIDMEKDAVPHHVGARRMAPMKAENANEEVRHLWSLDLIEPCYSPWACGIVMAKKKGNQLRFCRVFRFLNAKTIQGCLPVAQDWRKSCAARMRHLFHNLGSWLRFLASTSQGTR